MKLNEHFLNISAKTIQEDREICHFKSLTNFSREVDFEAITELN